MLNRALNGFDPISDEMFYLYTNIDNEHKRIYFLSFVQLFSSEMAPMVITTINMLCLLASFLFLKKVNFNNGSITFFQLIYFTAIATYVFRDSIMLLIVVAILYLVFSGKFLYKVSVSNVLSMKFLLLIFLLFVLVDFRVQFTIFFIFSFFLTKYLMRLSNVQLLFFLILSFSSSIFILNYVLQSFSVYGVSAASFIESRGERHSVDLTVYTLASSFLKHFFAPLPLSLLERALQADSTYSSLDDIYRMFYKSFVYVASFFLILKIKLLLEAIEKWKAEFLFLSIFSLSNAAIYTLFSFGGGHERTKIFSVLFIAFAVSAINNLEKKGLRKV